MMIQEYRKEYNEVLVLLDKIPSYDYNKIPGEEIEFFKNHSDKDYLVDDNSDIREFSREAFAIYTRLFRDYIASEEEKQKLEEILALNRKINMQNS